MAYENVYKLRDHPDFSNEIDVPFAKKLQPELICSACNCVTAAGLKDGKDHVYCRRCAEVLTDACNQFTCYICQWNAPLTSMKKNADEWAILENAPSACPNRTKTCRFNGKLRDVLDHYKTCNLKGKASCTLCGTLQDIKTIADHMKKNCPMRYLECNFCGADVHARDKVRHELNCDQRPDTCENCGKHFRTRKELERQHKAVCQLMPVDCSFRQLGCDYRATRREMESHEASAFHNDLLVRKICRLEKENQDLKNSFHQTINNVKGACDDTIQQMETKLAQVQESANAERTLRSNLEEKVLTLQNEFQNHNNSFHQVLSTVNSTCDDTIPQMQREMAELQESANAERTVRATLEERVLTLQNELQVSLCPLCNDEMPKKFIKGHMKECIQKQQDSLPYEVSLPEVRMSHAANKFTVEHCIPIKSRLYPTRNERPVSSTESSELTRLLQEALSKIYHLENEVTEVQIQCETRIAKSEKTVSDLKECHGCLEKTLCIIREETNARLDALKEVAYEVKGDMETLQVAVPTIQGDMRNVQIQCETRIAKSEKTVSDLEECQGSLEEALSVIREETNARLDAVEEAMKDVNEKFSPTVHTLQAPSRHMHGATQVPTLLDDLVNDFHHVRNVVPVQEERGQGKKGHGRSK
ncbi:TNF receptor-associated factor 5-like isoform X2 [Dermacentor albipictus]|uniref:TNF receptor-associated factor 5-like isoform X2 n=1 Tax=Dermacentor albipictus TaxID=60249 RepID=UPI0038FCDDE0